MLKRNPDMFDVIFEVESIVNSLRFEAALLLQEGVDLNIISETIHRRCDDLSSCSRTISRLCGINSAHEYTLSKLGTYNHYNTTEERIE